MASYIGLIFLISTFGVFSLASGDANIDCGSSDIYTDDNSMVWNGDDDYVRNGESRVVRNTVKSDIHQSLNTLRMFTTRKKNCYSVSAVEGARVLVRASFYYGNYDNKLSPPTFDLQFDGNHWATVVPSSTDYVHHEVIYVVKNNNYVSVCVAQTKPGQFPFISALQVHTLDSTMYTHVDQGYPLHLIRRVAYGTNQTIRYIDDFYDRIWTPELAGGGTTGLTNVASDALLIPTAGLLDQPPSAVLMNAITATSPTGQIKLPMGFLPADQNNIPVYLNMYFSEITQLDTATQLRSFQVLVDNEPLLDQSISPPYQSFEETYAANLTLSSKSSFTLVPTTESTLPPLINAMEVFQIGDVMTDGTNSEDVKGLDSLQESFPVLQGWSSGDPCLPMPYSWDWINCTNDPIPRVTALYLGSFDLSGELPDFSSMDALETIDFRNNSLDGPIPEFLATFPNLKQLNLASNQFKGPVPGLLSKKKGLNLVVTGNPDLCTSGNSCKTTTDPSTVNMSPGFSSSGSGSKKKSNKLPVILGTTIPSIIFIWAVLGFFFIMHHRRKTAAVANQGSSATNPQMMGKIGEAIMNEIKVNIEDQCISELANQPNGTTSVTS